MIARPDTAACAGRPRCAWPDPSAAAAPPTQKTSVKAAIASAAARRRSGGRSGKDRLQRHPDDLKASREPSERELAEIVLGYAQHGGGVVVARELQRLRDVGQQLPERRADRVGLSRLGPDGLAQEPHAVSDVASLVVVDLRVALDKSRQQ